MWIEYVYNPRAISHLYNDGNIPPLEAVEVTLIRLDPGGPMLRFDLDLPGFADHRPKRWHPEWNTVQIQLDFWSIKNLKILGFTNIPILSFKIERAASDLSIEASGQNCQISFYCDTIYIQEVTGYINTERK